MASLFYGKKKLRLFDHLRDILESAAAINDLKTIILVLNYPTVLVHVYVY